MLNALSLAQDTPRDAIKRRPFRGRTFSVSSCVRFPVFFLSPDFVFFKPYLRSEHTETEGNSSRMVHLFVVRNNKKNRNQKKNYTPPPPPASAARRRLDKVGRYKYLLPLIGICVSIFASFNYCVVAYGYTPCARLPPLPKCGGGGGRMGVGGGKHFLGVVYYFFYSERSARVSKRSFSHHPSKVKVGFETPSPQPTHPLALLRRHGKSRDSIDTLP